MRNRDMKAKKYITPILLAMVLLLTISTGVFGLTGILLRDVPVRVEIIEGMKWLGIYNSAEMVDGLTAIQLPIFQRGTSHTVHMWVRNDGVEPLDCFMEQSVLLFDWGDVTFTPASFTLQKDESIPFDMTVTVKPDAVLGWVNFSVHIMRLE